MTGPRLVHVGNAVVDLVMTVPRLPERGGDVLADRQRIDVGGGFTVMAAAARAGVPVAYGGMHGTGPFGDRVRAALRREGVVALQAPVPELDTGTVVVLVEPDGERSFVTSPGAEARLSRAALARVRPAPGDVVHVSGYGLVHERNRDALGQWLPGLPAGVTVVLDPGPLLGLVPGDVVDAVLRRVDWCSASAAEAAALTGLDAPDAAAAALARMLRLATDGPTGGAVVRLGPAGCLVAAGRDLPVHVPGLAVVAVDLNGAGDTHVGTFEAGLLLGMAPLDAARRAGAAAALAVTREGPATAPTRAELDAALAELTGRT